MRHSASRALSTRGDNSLDANVAGARLPDATATNTPTTTPRRSRGQHHTSRLFLQKTNTVGTCSAPPFLPPVRHESLGTMFGSTLMDAP